MGSYSTYRIEASENIALSFDEGGELDSGFFETEDPTKWYSFEVEMIRHSKEHPSVLFSCFRSGEQNGDVEWYWFRGGKSYSWRPPEPTPPPFDASKLR